MRRVLIFILFAATVPAALATSGSASARPVVLSPDQADRVTAGAASGDLSFFRVAHPPGQGQTLVPLHVESPDDGARTEHNFWASAPTTTPRNALSALVQRNGTIHISPRPDSWESDVRLVLG